MARHAVGEQRKDVGVVRILSEAKTATVFHERLELNRLILAELAKSYLLLLSLDSSILLVLGATRQTLPW